MDSKKQRIVFKVGSSTLIHQTGKANIRHISSLARVLSDLHNAGNEIVLVTSGAIGAGVGKLNLHSRPSDAAGRQAAAAVGQCELMFMYDKLFSEYSNTVGQLLITKGDVDDEERRNNLISTFEKLFELGAIPIVNENDSVALDEIFGDNDSLSATVAALIDADLLVILTDTDGLYDDDPSKNSGAKLIHEVHGVTSDVEALAGGAGTPLGTGGMATKLHAASIVNEAGIDAVIMNGSPAENIYRLVDGEDIGTRFFAKE